MQKEPSYTIKNLKKLNPEVTSKKFKTYRFEPMWFGESGWAANIF